jgi:probable HAF family extracellular repeat protein
MRAARTVLFENGTVTDLGTLTDANGGSALSINNHGQIVGFASAGTDVTYAVRFDRGTVTNLGGPPASPFSASAAAGISDAGTVVGWSTGVGGGRRAAVFENGVAAEIGCLPGGSVCRATSINNQGAVVGQSRDGGSDQRAVLWTPR